MVLLVMVRFDYYFCSVGLTRGRHDYDGMATIAVTEAS